MSTDVAYSPATDTFATSSVAEPRLKVWSFNTKKELFTLEGHTAEVSHVAWCSYSGVWISGSEDNSVRMWGPTGDSLLVVHCEGAVTALSTDLTFGHLLIATDDNIIRVYSPRGKLLQVNRGHADVVNAIIHLPASKHYVSAGWDKTIRIWHGYSESTEKQQPMQQVSYDGYAQRVMNGSNEITQLGFADLHPLVLPKIMRVPTKHEYFVSASSPEGLSAHHSPQEGKNVLDSIGLAKKLDELDVQLRKKDPSK